MKRNFIFEIGKYLVSSDILTEYFACDYAVCKGACCIIGDSGAPVEDSEDKVLRAEYLSYAPYMTLVGKEEVEKKGFSVIDSDGDRVTPLVNNMECAYTCFNENGDCFCAIEKAFTAGESKFKKPISCALYPIRLSSLSNGFTALNLHRWNICSCAFTRGRREKIPAYVFLKDVIIAHFGQEFYSALEEAAKSFNASS